MVNKASNVSHEPVRTCVVCRNRNLKEKLIRFVILAGNYIIDYRLQLPGRGFYLCDNHQCINRLDKWIKKRRKKRD